MSFFMLTARLFQQNDAILIATTFFQDVWVLTLPEQSTRRRILSSLSLWSAMSLINLLNLVPCLSPSTSSNSDKVDRHCWCLNKFLGDMTISGFRKSRWICSCCLHSIHSNPLTSTEMCFTLLNMLAILQRSIERNANYKGYFLI